jgi:hypothetical protein
MNTYVKNTSRGFILFEENVIEITPMEVKSLIKTMKHDSNEKTLEVLLTKGSVSLGQGLDLEYEQERFFLIQTYNVGPADVLARKQYPRRFEGLKVMRLKPQTNKVNYYELLVYPYSNSNEVSVYQGPDYSSVVSFMARNSIKFANYNSWELRRIYYGKLL